jgi:hypothetical protein
MATESAGGTPNVPQLIAVISGLTGDQARTALMFLLLDLRQGPGSWEISRAIDHGVKCHPVQDDPARVQVTAKGISYSHAEDGTVTMHVELDGVSDDDRH